MKKLMVLFGMALSLSFPQQALAVYDDEPMTSDKVYNVMFQPVALVLGIINAEFGMKIDDHWVAGPTLAFWNAKVVDIQIRATSIGGRARYYFDPAFTRPTWYLTGGLGYNSVDASITHHGVNYSGKASGLGILGGGGWHWFWKNFNMNIGGTLSAGGASKIELKDENGNKYKDDATPSAAIGLEFGLGWLF